MLRGILKTIIGPNPSRSARANRNTSRLCSSDGANKMISFPASKSSSPGVIARVHQYELARELFPLPRGSESIEVSISGRSASRRNSLLKWLQNDHRMLKKRPLLPATATTAIWSAFDFTVRQGSPSLVELRRSTWFIATQSTPSTVSHSTSSALLVKFCFPQLFHSRLNRRYLPAIRCIMTDPRKVCPQAHDPSRAYPRARLCLSLIATPFLFPTVFHVHHFPVP